METATKQLSWQKLRHLLDGAGVLEVGWKVGAKRNSDLVAMIWYPGKKPPGKRRMDKLTKALDANHIAYRDQGADAISSCRIGIPRMA